jgi:hypothetical protein
MSESNVKALGAVGDAKADDTAALQAAVNAAQATGGAVTLPAGTYRTTAPLNVTGAVRISGDGYAGLYGLSSPPYRGSAILFDPPAGSTAEAALSIRSTLPTLGERFQIVFGPNAPKVPAIRLDGAAADIPHLNVDSIFRDVAVLGAWIGFQTVNAARWSLDHCLFDGCAGASTHVQDVADPDTSEATVTNCVMSGAPSGGHVLHASGGDLRVVNNKLNGGNAGVYLLQVAAPLAGFGTLIVANNSIEGADYGVVLQRQPGQAGFMACVIVQGNEIVAAKRCLWSRADSAQAWVQGLVVQGNYLQTNPAYPALELEAVDGAAVTGNYLAAGSTLAKYDHPTNRRVTLSGNG